MWSGIYDIFYPISFKYLVGTPVSFILAVYLFSGSLMFYHSGDYQSSGLNLWSLDFL